MQAQTIKVRRTARIPWVAVLLAVVLAAALVIGTSMFVGRDAVTQAPTTFRVIDPKDTAPTSAYPGFRTNGHQVPAAAVGHHTATADDGGTGSVAIAPNGKPLS